MKVKLFALAAVAAMGMTVSMTSAATLDDVKKNDFLRCGVAPSTPGFAAADSSNNWAGLDIDFCKAIAAAIFNDATKVRYTPLSSTERFTALSAGEVDLLSRTTTWTMSRDTQLGIMFAGTTYYDGQGFMVHSSLGVKSVKDLGGATICIEKGTTTELNAADYFAANGLEYNPVTFVTQDEAYKAYEEGRCDAFTTDRSAMAGTRLTLAVPDDHVLLPEVISKEPLTSVVRQGDDLWFKIARWTFNAMLQAEELGVSSANVDEMLASENPPIKRLLGVEGDYGTPLGLTKDWAYQIVKNVGNYAEIFDKNVGAGSPIGLERGVNALWKDGGLQYSPPI